MALRVLSSLVVLSVLATLPVPAQSPPSGTGDATECGAGSNLDPDLAQAREEVLAWIGDRRAEEGLEPLAPDPILCGVAQRRADDVARAGSVDSTTATVTRVSRRLLSSGYQAHRWTERAILGYRPPVHLVREWSRSGQASYRQTVLGEFEEIGVGIEDVGEGTAVVLLFAVPRISWFRDQVKPLEDLEEVRRVALEGVNRYRSEKGRGAVEADPELDRAAQAHAEDMLERGYYGHRSPDGLQPRDWVQRTRYPELSFLAENIAKGLFLPGETVDRWMDSRDHRHNILHPKARETGLGVAFGDTSDGFQVLWVQLFAAPR
jgi:uncharacterized protein YkwD